ncbi:MAG: flavin reductase family protein [Thermoanaerobaculia bacterium]
MKELVVAVDESRFKQALSYFASGVTVVTTESGGHRYGLTVSAFSSLSLNPPLVLICVEKSVRAHDLIPKAERFAVNVLSSEQEAVSNRFASKVEDRFEGIATHEGQLGVPLIDGALAAIECRLHDTLAGGDHTIFIGEVVNTEIHEGSPLIYYRSRYRALR